MRWEIIGSGRSCLILIGKRVEKKIVVALNLDFCDLRFPFFDENFLFEIDLEKVALVIFDIVVLGVRKSVAQFEEIERTVIDFE